VSENDFLKMAITD